MLLDSLARLGGTLLRAWPGLERPVFDLLRSSDTRPFRSIRFRLFKAWAAGLEGNRAVRCVSLPNDLRLMVHVNDWCGIAYVEPQIIEPITSGYLLENLRPGDVFADIGANVGYMTILAARRVGPSGAVWCFEPNPRLIEMIRESVLRNGFGRMVHPVEVALAEVDDTNRPFYLSNEPANSGLSSLTPDTDHQALGKMDMGAGLQVEVVTLDTFAVRQRMTRLDAVKIDVEGAEHLVVAGMRESLARFRPRFIICETALDSPAVSALERFGYRGRMLEAMGTSSVWGNMLFEPMGNSS